MALQSVDARQGRSTVLLARSRQQRNDVVVGWRRLALVEWHRLSKHVPVKIGLKFVQVFVQIRFSAKMVAKLHDVFKNI